MNGDRSIGDFDEGTTRCIVRIQRKRSALARYRIRSDIAGIVDAIGGTIASHAQVPTSSQISTCGDVVACGHTVASHYVIASQHIHAGLNRIQRADSSVSIDIFCKHIAGKRTTGSCNITSNIKVTANSTNASNIKIAAYCAITTNVKVCTCCQVGSCSDVVGRGHAVASHYVIASQHVYTRLNCTERADSSVSIDIFREHIAGEFGTSTSNVTGDIKVTANSAIASNVKIRTSGQIAPCSNVVGRCNRIPCNNRVASQNIDVRLHRVSCTNGSIQKYAAAYQSISADVDVIDRSQAAALNIACGLNRVRADIVSRNNIAAQQYNVTAARIHITALRADIAAVRENLAAV